MNVDFIISGGSGKIKTLVPIMGSNEQDGITLSSNSSALNQQQVVYRLFNGDISTPPPTNTVLWICANKQYAQIAFPTPTAVKMIFTYAPFVGAYSCAYPASVSIDVSNDGIEFRPLKVEQLGDKNNLIFTVTHPSPKKIYRFTFTTLTGNEWVGLTEILLL